MKKGEDLTILALFIGAAVLSEILIGQRLAIQPTRRLSGASRILVFLVGFGGSRDAVHGNAYGRDLRRTG
jgi:hypothetical protein